MTDWIEWNGGECPVDGEVEVWFRGDKSGVGKYAKARVLRWSHSGDISDIIRYRVLNERPIVTPVETLRDRFAMAALTGMLARNPADAGPFDARRIFILADAMMEARSK